MYTCSCLPVFFTQAHGLTPKRTLSDYTADMDGKIERLLRNVNARDMPASIISQMSYSGRPHSQMAANLAKNSADQEVSVRIQRGVLNLNDPASIAREYRDVYKQEYYKFYAQLLTQGQQSRITYVITDNLATKKYYAKHTVANFSKTNCFIHVHKGCITVGRINYPIDEDIETKEAFLTDWPGPLDQTGDQLKRDVTDYIDTLWQHDSQRCIKYSNHDDHRKTILKLLTELLHRNGTIDAPGITRLLLRPEQTEIQKEEGNKQPLETLKKYLLLGKRSEAIKFAKTKKLWDHAQCLAFLDKYQPPNTGNYIRDGSRLKDDSIVQLNDEYLASMEPGILQTVYKSLLNRILKSDPESVNIIKYPNVEGDLYKFALLSANDCEMEFDQTNEIFKLIVAIKQAIVNPYWDSSHLISLGFISIEHGNDTSDDISYRSNLSFMQGDNHAQRTLTISNTDMLILNEIWEYCLNLARGTCDPNNYRYIINLVPYKLVFATRLFDYGMYHMFYNYLCSIKNALSMGRSQAYVGSDPFYDWETIEKCVEHLDQVWSLFLAPPEFNQRPIQEEVTDFAPKPISLPPREINPFDPQPVGDDYPNEPSPNNLPLFSPPPFVPPGNVAAVTCSSPKEDLQQPNPSIGDSFPSPFSPINEHDDLPRRDSDFNRRDSNISNNINVNDRTAAGNSMGDLVANSNNSNNGNESQPSDGQQSGFLGKFYKATASLIPKSNSTGKAKEMILPDDTEPTIIYDHQKGGWVNTTQPEEAENSLANDAPPMFDISSAPNYSLSTKSSNMRYPKPPSSQPSRASGPAQFN